MKVSNCFTMIKAIFLLLILGFFIITVPACNLESDSDVVGRPNDSIEVPTPVSPPPDISFKFGVMGDTQWAFDLDDPTGLNKHTVAGSYISQINSEMISHGVKFVIQVGDLTNYGYDEAIAQREKYARPLYDAGIGFFPMRGNHEPWGDMFDSVDTDADGEYDTAVQNSYAIPAIQANFPQTQGGLTVMDVLDPITNEPVLDPITEEPTGETFEQLNTGNATNFSSPTNDTYPNMEAELAGISYAFDYDDENGNSATFVIIDPWKTDTMENPLFGKNYWANYGGIWILPFPYGYTMASQQEWISERIDSTTRGTEHAFVFSHQPLIGGNHEDSPFGFLAFDPTDITDETDPDYVQPSWADPGFVDPITDAPDNTADQNTFYADLVANDVAFYISGHDHLHDLSIVESPDGDSSMRQIICAPACPKFYNATYDTAEWRGAKADRKTTIDTEYDNSGYYIYTVDGPIVTVDYYSDATGNIDPSADYTPQFTFVKKNTFTYSLNGQSFMVDRGDSFEEEDEEVTDTYEGTTISIGGNNTSMAVDDPNGDETAMTTPLTKRITTAWKDQAQYTGIDSNVLILNGFKESATGMGNKYILTMSATGVTVGSGTWIVAMNNDGEFERIIETGAYQSGPALITYSVGSYGYDTTDNTIWTILDDNGIFAIRQ